MPITLGELKEWAAANGVPDEAAITDLDGSQATDLGKDADESGVVVLVLEFGEDE
jgi:hypothetical protein